MNLAEKTSILQDLLRKHHSANKVQKKKYFQVEENVLFFEEEKMPISVCDLPTIILYISERSICPQYRMFVNFFSISLVLQDNLTLCLCLFLCLSICCGKSGAQVV